MRAQPLSQTEPFFGYYTVSIYEDGRIRFPVDALRQLKEQGENHIRPAILPHPLAIFLIPEGRWPEWFRWAKKEFRILDTPEGHRIYLAGSKKTSLDDQGRFRLPRNMMAYAGIQEDDRIVLLLGVGKHFEVWNKDLYGQMTPSDQPNSKPPTE